MHSLDYRMPIAGHDLLIKKTSAKQTKNSRVHDLVDPLPHLVTRTTNTTTNNYSDHLVSMTSLPHS